MIAVSSLYYQYGAEDKTLSFPDFQVDKGKCCLLLGNSGSGKTTLLHLIGGLLRIQKGHIRIDGVDLAKVSDEQLDKLRGKYIGFIFQRNHLISALSVKQNLLMAPFLAGIRQDEGRVEEVLAQLGLWEQKNKNVNELSHGQAQRVAIARAVLNRPAVVLADEPTSALDDYNCERVTNLLMNVTRQNNCTLIVATHDQRLKSMIPTHVSIKNDV